MRSVAGDEQSGPNSARTDMPSSQSAWAIPAELVPLQTDIQEAVWSDTFADKEDVEEKDDEERKRTDEEKKQASEEDKETNQFALVADQTRTTTMDVEGLVSPSRKVSDWKRMHAGSPVGPRTITFTSEQIDLFGEQRANLRRDMNDEDLIRVPDRLQCQLQGANALLLAFMSPRATYQSTSTFFNGISITETTTCSVLDGSDSAASLRLLDLSNRECVFIDSLDAAREVRLLHQMGLTTMWSQVAGTTLVVVCEIAHLESSPSITIVFYDVDKVRLPAILTSHQVRLAPRWRYVSPDSRRQAFAAIDHEWRDPATRRTLRLSPPLDAGLSSSSLTVGGPSSPLVHSSEFHKHLEWSPSPPLSVRLLKKASMHLGSLALKADHQVDCDVSFPLCLGGEETLGHLRVRHYPRSASPTPTWLTGEALSLGPPETPRRRADYLFLASLVQRWLPKDLPTELEITLGCREDVGSFELLFEVDRSGRREVLDGMLVQLESRHEIRDRQQSMRALAAGLRVRFGLSVREIARLPDKLSLTDLFTKSLSVPRAESTPTTGARQTLPSRLLCLINKNPCLYRNEKEHRSIAEFIRNTAREVGTSWGLNMDGIMRSLRAALKADPTSTRRDRQAIAGSVELAVRQDAESSKVNAPRHELLSSSRPLHEKNTNRIGGAAFAKRLAAIKEAEGSKRQKQ